MKKIISLMLAALMCLGLFSFVGCKKKVSNDPQTLEIYVGNFGYGYNWLNAIIDEFEKEEWVREKYPELEIPDIQINSERNYGIDRTLSGDTNTIDLFFTAATINTVVEKEYKNGQSFFADLTDVYEGAVPGETDANGKPILFKDKMDSNFTSMSIFTHKDNTKSYYSVPWVAGMTGLLYNKTWFDENKIGIPLTTDQLIQETCRDIRGKNQIPFVFSSKESYWTFTLFLIWWAQYEGIANYANFYQALVPDGMGGYTQSVDVVKQDGRLESLKVIEDLISVKETPKNIHDDVLTMDFGMAQAKFFLREGVMMPNGDWFENEMRETAEEEGITDTFTFMRTPVISAIKDKVPDGSIADDKELQALIKAIDAEDPSLKGDGYDVTQKDYDKVKEARLIILPAANHTAYIPSYATAIEPAKDFLRYLATDKACRAFIEATHGANMPFEYDVEQKDPALYNSLAQIQKDRLAWDKFGLYLPNENTFKMAYLGKMYRLSFASSIDILLTVENDAEWMSAEDIYKADIAWWTPTRWNNALINAGYKK